MFNLNKEKLKEKVFLILQIIFVILTLVGAILLFIGKIKNAGYAIIPMLFSNMFGLLYKKTKKEIEANKK